MNLSGNVVRPARAACAAIALVTLGAARPAAADPPLPDLVFASPAPDNVYEVEETYGPDDCCVREGDISAGTHRVLRFLAQARNIGTADLVLGNPIGNPLFEPALCHPHFHFSAFAEFRLVDASGRVWRGIKRGFCLLDSARWDYVRPGVSDVALYTCSNQGIQLGVVRRLHSGDALPVHRHHRCSARRLHLGAGNQPGARAGRVRLLQ